LMTAIFTDMVISDAMLIFVYSHYFNVPTENDY